MSDENRTEAPTIKRIEKARAEGKFPIARELTSSLLFFASLLFLEFAGGTAVLRFVNWARELRNQPIHIETNSGTVMQVFAEMPRGFFPFVSILCGIIAAAFFLPALVAFLNRGWVFMPGKLAPDLSRLAPRFGLLFSVDSLWRLALAAVQITGALFICFFQVRKSASDTAVMTFQTDEWFGFFQKALFPITVQLTLLFLFLGMCDLFYQRWKYYRDLRMTKEEIRRETEEKD